MQTVCCRSQSYEQQNQPPGLFSPVLGQCPINQAPEALLDCLLVSPHTEIALELHSGFLRMLAGDSTSCLVLNDECVFTYEEEGLELQWEHIETKGRVQIVASNGKDFANFVSRLKKWCPQGGFGLRYKLMAKMSQGKNAEVYKAENLSDHQIYAVKVQEKNWRLGEQVSIMRELQHPNMIHLREYFLEDNHKTYIVMDYEDGGNLLERMTPPNSFSYRDKVKVVIDMINALELLRLKGIVHRDIKPENIVHSNKDGNYKIADFGLALRVGERMTRTSGTPGYMPPELLRADNCDVQADIRSDVYSMGLTFYEMFTGSQYYAGESRAEILDKNIKGVSFGKKSYESEDLYRVEKKLLEKMIRTKMEARKNSYEIMLSNTYGQLKKLYEHDSRLSNNSNDSKNKSSSSEEDKIMFSLRKMLRFKSG